MFSVKIAPTENVEALKEAIKEKNNTFEGVDARMLDLWKISIQIDNALKKNLENVDFTNGTLLPLTVLSTLFPEAPAEGQLHIVVKAPIGGELKSRSTYQVLSNFNSLRAIKAGSTLHAQLFDERRGR